MSGIKALIIDDDEFDRLLARRQLSRNPNFGEIVEAVHGLEAYEMFASGRVPRQAEPGSSRALVLLDINMPLMSGFDLLARIEAEGLAERNGEMVVAMLTSSAYVGDRERAESSPIVDHYIEKPLTPEGVQELLDTYWSDGDPVRV